MSTGNDIIETLDGSEFNYAKDGSDEDPHFVPPEINQYYLIVTVNPLAQMRSTAQTTSILMQPVQVQKILRKESGTDSITNITTLV